MPLPSEGNPISFNDLNIELGNNGDDTLDIESAAESLLESASRPHSMNEFYGTSLGDDFLFSDWDGSVNISEYGVITATVGNATSRTINTSNFEVVTSSTPRIVSITIVAPSTFNGQPVNNAGNGITGNKPFTQPAVGRYLEITADDTSLSGEQTRIDLTVNDRYYTDTPWEINYSSYLYEDGLVLASPFPITGTGDETIQINLSQNTSGDTRGSSFTVTGDIGGKSASVGVTQTSYTPIPEPSIYFSSITPSGPYPYNGIARITYTIVRTNASLFIGEISPAIDGNNAVFSSVQPSGITYNGPTSISGTGTTFYVEIPARGDDEEDTKNSLLNVSVSTGGGFDDADNIIQQEGYSLPVYTWGGSVSIDRLTGDVVVSNDDSAGTITISPISFNEYVTTPTPREVTIGNIIIPSGYQNAGTAESLDFNPTQQAAQRTLTATPSATDIGGGTTTIVLDINDVYYTDTSWELFEDFDNTISNLTFSPSSGTGDSPDTIISFGTNTSGGTKYGRFTLSGGDSLIEITITQNVYVPPATISISSVLPSSPYSYYGEGGITVTVSRTNSTSYNAFIDPLSPSNGAYFPSNQEGYDSPDQLTNLTSNTFKIDMPARDDGTIDTYKSSLMVTVSGGAPATYELQQTGLVAWNTSPSSLSFTTFGGTKNITLNSSYSWTAAVSGTGFSINTTSGTAGTRLISVTATQKDLGGGGTVTFSASGQSDIVVSLSQAEAPLEWDWFVNEAQQYSNSLTVSPSTTAQSYSVGLYTYRGSTAVASFWMLQRQAGTWITINTTTSGGTPFKTITSTQNTNGEPTLYLNVATNTGSSARNGSADISIDGLYVATIYVNQAGVSGGGGGGGGGAGGTDPEEQQ